MIKNIILDVDGVIIGTKLNQNFPYPSKLLAQKLKVLNKSGITVSLCTSKPYFSIRQIVKDCNLNSLHITDSGATITDGSTERSIINNRLFPELISELASFIDNTNLYAEFYTSNNWLARKNIHPEWIESGKKVLLQDPKLVDNFSQELSNISESIPKIVMITENDIDQDKISNIYKKYEKDIEIILTSHPVIPTVKISVITPKNISKSNALLQISEILKLNLQDALAVGDTLSDYKFMSICKYKGIMGNSDDKLKELAKTDANAYIGKHVDEDGLLDIFEHFGL